MRSAGGSPGRSQQGREPGPALDQTDPTSEPWAAVTTDETSPPGPGTGSGSNARSAALEVRPAAREVARSRLVIAGPAIELTATSVLLQPPTRAPEVVPESPGTSQETSGSDSWMPGLIALIVGMFMSVLDTSIVNIAIPGIQNDFAATAEDVQWVSTSYTLTEGVVVTVSAWLGNRIGHKKLYRTHHVVLNMAPLEPAMRPEILVSDRPTVRCGRRRRGRTACRGDVRRQCGGP